MIFAAAGIPITNEVRYANGEVVRDVLGGAPVYAAAAVRLFADSAVYIANVGADFEALYGDFMRAAGITPCVEVLSDHTPYSILQYQPDGSYSFEELHGMRNRGYLAVRPCDIERNIDRFTGLYLFDGLDNQTHWHAVAELRRRVGFRLMWEIEASSAVSENLDLIRARARECDMFSINHHEASALFGTDDEGAIIAALREMDLPIYFRRGRRGAIMLAPGCPDADVPLISAGERDGLDPTGCGNSSTAAAFYAWSIRGDTRYAAVCGNVAAAICSCDHGPALANEDNRRLAAELVAAHL